MPTKPEQGLTLPGKRGFVGLPIMPLLYFPAAAAAAPMIAIQITRPVRRSADVKNPGSQS